VTDQQLRRAAADVICRKWATRLGLCFHPDTRGTDYVSGLHLSAEEIAQYDADMATLASIDDRYERSFRAFRTALRTGRTSGKPTP